MKTSAAGPSRINRFKRNIIKRIPRFPNNKQSLDFLKNEGLSSLLIHYFNWVIRYVPARQREIIIEPSATQDVRWNKLEPELENLFLKVKNGEDLTSHLSLRPHTRGYTPNLLQVDKMVDKWTDKDFILNVMGYHHFHLGCEFESNGAVKRSDELLFAKVLRNEFNVIGIFDHSVFENKDNLSKEGERLWEAFEEHSSRGIPPGSVYIPTMITTSGHSANLVQLANHYSRIIQSFDSKLENKQYVQELFNSVEFPERAKLKLFWDLDFMDLCLLEQSTKRCFVVYRAPY